MGSGGKQAPHGLAPWGIGLPQPRRRPPPIPPAQPPRAAEQGEWRHSQHQAVLPPLRPARGGDRWTSRESGERDGHDHEDHRHSVPPDPRRRRPGCAHRRAGPGEMARGTRERRAHAGRLQGAQAGSVWDAGPSVQRLDGGEFAGCAAVTQAFLPALRFEGLNLRHLIAIPSDPPAQEEQKKRTTEVTPRPDAAKGLPERHCVRTG